MAGGGGEGGQRGEGPADDGVKAGVRRPGLGAVAHDGDIVERQADAAVFQKAGFLAVAVEQRVTAFGRQHREHDAGDTGAAADIEDVAPAQVRHRRGAVQHQAGNHVGQFCDGGEVVDAVPLLQQAQPRQQRIYLRVAGLQAEFGQAPAQ